MTGTAIGSAKGRGFRCLYCLALLPGLDAPCGICGRRTRRCDRKTYWNLLPWLVRLERDLKIGAVLLTVALVAVLTQSGPAYSTSSGWFYALPFFFGLALWRTISKLTRHEPYFLASVFWVALFACLTVFAVLYAPGYAVIPCALAVGCALAAREFAKWKRSLRGR